MGRTSDFKAWHVREDVCRSLGIEGRFGFVIPFSVLRGLGDVVTVRDRQGGTLVNGSAISLGRREVAPIDAAEAAVILHIPKTAGTSLIKMLTHDLPPYERLFIYPPPFGLTLEEVATLPLHQRRAARLIAGHVLFGVDRFLGRTARYVTFLRDPIVRLRSHAAHHLKAGTKFRWKGLEIKAEVAITEGLNEEFDNLMVRYIAGLPPDLVPLGGVSRSDVDLALFNIESYFALVGLVETIQAHMGDLSSALGRSFVDLPRENTTTEPARQEVVRAEIDWNRVERNNQFDRVLYEIVRDRQAAKTGKMKSSALHLSR